MKKLTLILILGLFGSYGSLSIADESSHHPTAPPMPRNFATLKKLVGTWEGSYKKDNKEETTTLTHELTSGGTALLERLSPGTAHEMATIYFAEGGNVSATHYCMLGNHPKMVLKNASKKKLFFEMNDNTGLQSAMEPHIHALTVSLHGDNKLTQEWVFYENGKAKETSVFKFSRKK